MRLVRPLAAALALFALVSVLGALTAAPASAAVRVQATVGYQEGADGLKRGLRLQIWRDGYKWLDEPPSVECDNCGPLQPYPEEAGLPEPARVIQLDASPEPEVVFTMYSAGAHCCTYTEIFAWDPDKGYTSTTHDFLDGSYNLEYLRDGVPFFVDTDTRLAYRFSCYMCAVYPPQIFQYRNGALADVTRSFPGEVRAHLAKTKRYYVRARSEIDVRGFLATIAAEYCLLDSCKAGFKFVRRAVKAGFARAREPRWEIGPHGRKFIPALRRVLRQLGYL